MSDPSPTEPNSVVREVYEQLGMLLEDGDDAFVAEGPALLQEAIQEPGFFEGVEAKHASRNAYTRTKVIGDPGRHVIRYMEWPPEYSLLPHEHHGCPCFEVIVEGQLFVTQMSMQEIGAGTYLLDVEETETCMPGDAAVVDPRNGSGIHSVYSPVRTRTLHVYPDDNYYTYGYVQQDTERRGDVYTRERFQLQDGE